MRTLLIILIAMFSFTFQGKTQDAQKIIEQSTDVIEFESSEMSASLLIHDGRGNTRERKVAVATRTFDGVTKTLMRFLSPAEVAGTSILIHDYEDKADDMWIYLPSMRRTRRIVTTEKGKSFMGSEFSNADMSKPNIDDFNYKLLGEEEYEGKQCYKIETVAKDRNVAGEYGFNKKISLIEKETLLIYMSELFDRNDNLIKVHTFADYRKQPNGRYFSYDMEMKNLKTKRFSQMKIHGFQLGSQLGEENFTVANLEK